MQGTKRGFEMSIRFRIIAAVIGAAALVGAVGVDVAQAGTFPKGGHSQPHR